MEIVLLTSAVALSSQQLHKVCNNNTVPNNMATNETKNVSSYDVDEAQAMAQIAIETIFLILGTYLIISLFYYAAKKFRKAPESAASRTIERRKRVLFGLVVYFAFTSVGKFALAQWIYYIPDRKVTADQCATFSLVFQVFNTTGLIALYMFLWLRQYTLYQEPHLKHYATTCIIRFSRALFVVIIVVGIAALVGVATSNRAENFVHIEGSNACLLRNENTLNSLTIYIGYSVIILLQASILSLFIHILRRYQNTINLEDAGTSTNKRVHRLVRNCTIAAAISATSDITAIILRVVYRGVLTELTIFTIWDVDAFINLSCTILCFSNWKEIVWPWPCRVRIETVDKQPATTSFTKEQQSRTVSTHAA
ncbi:unnamed protein product [Clavelina lepadiformis]|uniref:Vomeronasal type-1 receptor n=1 Tax=Clavelina lepadiformis TaxID=159417 RepID=A0ABP0FW75_CLALP